MTTNAPTPIKRARAAKATGSTTATLPKSKATATRARAATRARVANPVQIPVQTPAETPAHRGGFWATVDALNPVTIAKTLLPISNTPVQQLVFYGAVAGLAAAEIIEPLIAVLIVGGHILHRSTNPIAESLGEVLDEAR